MVLTSPLVCEKVWLDKPKYDAAERLYYEKLAQSSASGCGESRSNNLEMVNATGKSELLDEVEGDGTQDVVSKSSSVTCKKSSKSVKILPEKKLHDHSDKTVSHNKADSKCVSNITSNPDTKSSELGVVSKLKGSPPPPQFRVLTPSQPLPSKVISPPKSAQEIHSNTSPPPQTSDLPTSPPSTDLIIPINTDNTNSSLDQEKKESKKRKRNKKERRDKKGVTPNPNSWNSLAGEVAKARQHIKNSLQCIDDIAVTTNTVSVEVANRVVALEKENQELTLRMQKLEERVGWLEKQLAGVKSGAGQSSPAPQSAAPSAGQPVKSAPVKEEEDNDDGVDLFASDSEEEDAEAAKIKEQRLAEYAAKKSKKPVLIAKSSIILDVKPWDDETDMKLLEQEVRKITCDGLLWGASKLVPLAYGIHKLQITCVVEDEKVSVDWLQETIQEIEDYVQSVDIAAFNKI